MAEKITGEFVKLEKGEVILTKEKVDAILALVKNYEKLLMDILGVAVSKVEKTGGEPIKVNLNPRNLSILKFLNDTVKSCSSLVICKGIGLKVDKEMSLLQNITKLVKAGLIVKQKEGKGEYTFYLSEKGKEKIQGTDKTANKQTDGAEQQEQDQAQPATSEAAADPAQPAAKAAKKQNKKNKLN